MSISFIVWIVKPVAVCCLPSMVTLSRAQHPDQEENRVEKRYLCLLDGKLKQDRVEVDEPIGQFERSGQTLYAGGCRG